MILDASGMIKFSCVYLHGRMWSESLLCEESFFHLDVHGGMRIDTGGLIFYGSA